MNTAQAKAHAAESVEFLRMFGDGEGDELDRQMRMAANVLKRWPRVYR